MNKLSTISAALIAGVSYTANAELLISEVLYDAPNSDATEEWVEIYNPDCKSVDLSNYVIRDNGSTFALSGTIAPDSYITIARNASGFTNLYQKSADITGMSLSLSNSGDYVELVKGIDVVDLVAWEGKVAGWDLNASNTTIYRTTATGTSTEQNWGYSGDTGTPGSGPLASTCTPAPENTGLKITEVLYDAPNSDKLEEFVEIFNPSCSEVNLSGYSLADNNGNYSLSGQIKGGAYYIIAKDADGFAALFGKQPDNSGLSLSLGNSGDRVTLKNGDSAIDMVAWEGNISGWNVSAVNTSLLRTAQEDTDTEADWASGLSTPHEGAFDAGCSGEGSNTDPGGESGNYQFDQYYASVTGLSGSNLKQGLNTLMKGHTRLTYSQVWDALKYADEDPDNTSNVILLYTGRSQDKELNSSKGNTGDMWNREHVWPKSHGFRTESQHAYTDVHHLRPADASVNSTRSNKDFDLGGDPITESPENLRDTDSFEPRDAVKGDVARMIFYMDVRYEGNDATGTPDLEIVDYTGTQSDEPLLGKLCTLLAWHNQDPVDSWEQRRHSRVVEVQGNRNPFIDNPQWANELYGSSCL